MISISNLLIIISSIFTFIALFNPNIYIFGMNDYFINQDKYILFFAQFFTSNFLHGSFLHLLMNCIFIYYFGNIVELLIGKKKYIAFILSSFFFIGISLLVFSMGNTIGISGFCMALLTYYTFELKRRNNPEYKGGITALILNVGIGFAPGISLVGHLFGAIYGLLFFYINQLKNTTSK